MKSLIKNTISVVLVFMALNFLFTGSPIPWLGSGGNIKSFNQALNYANDATRISNKNSSFSTFSNAEVVEMITLRKKSIGAATEVSIEELNSDYPGFGSHFRDEFIEGSRLLVHGLENDDAGFAIIQGQILLENWADWYEINRPKIRNRE